MPSWVLAGQLARGSRPGYSGERERSVPIAEVRSWVAEAHALGIRSVICLLADDQLGLYDEIPDGLLTFYQRQGFTVEHVPAEDRRSPPLTDEHLERIWTAYEVLPKPVLVHCSAGVDRTGQAIGHILRKLK
jgi:protein-tyrosine phosphatase